MYRHRKYEHTELSINNKYYLIDKGDDPRGCLARAVDWRFFLKDGKWFARETNTMPQVS